MESFSGQRHSSLVKQVCCGRTAKAQPMSIKKTWPLRIVPFFSLSRVICNENWIKTQALVQSKHPGSFNSRVGQSGKPVGTHIDRDRRWWRFFSDDALHYGFVPLCDYPRFCLFPICHVRSAFVHSCAGRDTYPA